MPAGKCGARASSSSRSRHTSAIMAGLMRGYATCLQAGQMRERSLACNSVGVPQTPQWRCARSHSSTCAARPASAISTGANVIIAARSGTGRQPGGTSASASAQQSSASSVPR